MNKEYWICWFDRNRCKCWRNSMDLDSTSVEMLCSYLDSLISTKIELRMRKKVVKTIQITKTHEWKKIWKCSLHSLSTESQLKLYRKRLTLFIYVRKLNDLKSQQTICSKKHCQSAYNASLINQIKRFYVEWVYRGPSNRYKFDKFFDYFCKEKQPLFFLFQKQSMLSKNIARRLIVCFAQLSAWHVWVENTWINRRVSIQSFHSVHCFRSRK